MSGYMPAAIVVLADERTDRGRFITLRLLDDVVPPLASASLVPLSGEWEDILELHRVVEARRDEATFATTDGREIPAIPLGLQGWWMPDALALVTDTRKRWREVSFDDSRFADFCPLCFTGLDGGQHVRTDNERSICDPCRAKYIVEDYLGLRL